ncbi:MAG: hypothetical protein OWQ54_04765 [Sulfolobaceae archaeon]|nr:hypothetical protein [Sulfolobaceae archaeon]
MKIEILAYEIKHLLTRPLILASIIIFVVIGIYESYYLVPICFTLGVTLPAIVSTSSILFSTLYPLVVVYIAYTNYAKPKAEGALESVLATPVSRSEVFLSRMTSGTVIIFISVIAYTLAISFFIWYLFVGVVATEFQGLLLFILSSFLELAMLYWIFMAIGSISRTQGQYIIFSAIALAIFEGLSFLAGVFPGFSWLIYSFTPIGISQGINSVILSGFLSQPPLPFWISPIIWMALPPYLGVRHYTITDQP